MAQYTISQTEQMYFRMYCPGGSYRYDEYSRPTQLRVKRDFAAELKGAKGQRAARLRGSLAGIQACLDAGKEDAKLAKRVTARQEGGDDGYHWVVRKDGRMVANGLTKGEAEYEKKRQRDQLKSR